MKVSPDRLAMMMLGGSPIKVAAPPMFDARTSAIRNGVGEMASRSQTSRVTGAISSTVVTLSKNAEASAVIRTSSSITRNGEPLARFTAQIATYSNTPVRRSTETMIIIPSSRKITSQSMPVSGEKNASSAEATPRARMMPAPASAVVTFGTRSLAMRMYATTKTATATIAVTGPPPDGRVDPLSDAAGPAPAAGTR